MSQPSDMNQGIKWCETVLMGATQIRNNKSDRWWHEKHWAVSHRPDCHITAETWGVSTSVCSTNRSARQTVQNCEHLPVLPSYHTVKQNFSFIRHRDLVLHTQDSDKKLKGWLILYRYTYITNTQSGQLLSYIRAMAHSDISWGH